MSDKIRIQYQEELDHPEAQGTGAFDLVVRVLDRGSSRRSSIRTSSWPNW